MKRMGRGVFGLGIVVVGLIAWWSWTTGQPAASPAQARTRPRSAPPAEAAAHGVEDDSTGGATLGGVVLDPKARPIPGAMVCVGQLDAPPNALDACRRTDLAGRYRHPVPPQVALRVAVQARGFVPALLGQTDERTKGESGRQLATAAPIVLNEAEQRGDFDVVLEPGGVAVRGSVLDITGGPVGGAVVGAVGQRSRSAITLTDADGRFELWVEPAPDGLIEVEARADGYARGTAFGPASNYTRVIRLTPESILSGTVVGPDGDAPAAGVVVRVMATGFGSGDVGRGTTDDRGRFVIGGMPPGRYAVHARRHDARGALDGTVAVGLAEHVEALKIVVRSAVTIEARVVQGSIGCPAGEVRLSDGTRGAIEDGRVTLRGVEAGTHQVRIRCHGFRTDPINNTLVVSTPPAAPPSPVWTVVRGATIWGFVRDLGGNPVGGVAIAAEPAEALGPDARTGESTTDAAGRFEIRGLTVGAHELWLEDGAWLLPAERPRASASLSGSDPVQVTVSAGGEVVARIVDAHGVAVAGERVALHSPGLTVVQRTDDAGVAHFRTVVPGLRSVSFARGWGGASRPSDEVAVREGERAEVELTCATKDHAVTGSVVDSVPRRA